MLRTQNREYYNTKWTKDTRNTMGKNINKLEDLGAHPSSSCGGLGALRAPRALRALLGAEGPQ